MTIIRLVNGSDAAVRLSVGETLAALGGKADAAGFVELPGDDGAIHIRPSGVVAVFEDARRGSAGFRVSEATG
jgi:hypothetical protein